MVNPLQMLVLVLEAARERLIALQLRREAQAQCALAAQECDTAGRAYDRLADHDLGHARSHLAIAADFAGEAAARLAPATAPADVEDSLARARHNARRALLHLELHTASHVEAIAYRTRDAEHTAWHARLTAFGRAHPVSDPVWVVAATDVVCVRCGDTRAPGDAIYRADGKHYCSLICSRSEQQDEGAAWYADHRDAETDRIARLSAQALATSGAVGTCALCCGFVYDDRFERTLPSGERVRFCSTECGAEAAQSEIDRTTDDRHELDEREIEAMYLAEGDAVDFEDCPF